MKFNKSQFSIGILLISLSVVGILFAFSKLSPSASPTSTFHSLNDIYNLITTGTPSSPHSPTATTSEPTAATSHSTTEIYLLLANKFKSEDLRPGTNIFGIVGTFGTPDSNYEEATSSVVSSLTPTYEINNLTGFTLDDIYNLVIATGTRKITGSPSFNSSSPTESMHTTTEIYNRLNNIKISLAASKFGVGKTIFGIDGSFSPIYQLNDYCGSNDECFTGYCDDWYQGICTNGAINDTCAHSSSCASGYCDDITNYQCTDGGPGSGCSSNAGCASPNICDTVNTYTCIDASNGAPCTSGSGCASGFCETVNNICSSGDAGSFCNNGDECNTYNCVSGLCSSDVPPITTHLVGYWPLNETSGTIAHDFSGNGYDGTFSGGVSVNSSGKVSKSFSFNGGGNIQINSTLGISTTMTLSAWVYLPASTNGSVINLGCSHSSCAPYNGIGIGIGEADFDYPGNNFMVVNNGITWDSPVESVGTGWHNLVVVMRGAGSLVDEYVDGVYRRSYEAVGYPFVAPTSGGLQIGGYDEDGYNRLFTGKIDEVAIWSRPLAPVEIANIYNNGNGVTLIGDLGASCSQNSECGTQNCSGNICSAPVLTTGLRGYWPFNETSGTTASDLSGNGNNGTLNGGVTINQTGKLGKAFSFNGSDSYVAIPSLDNSSYVPITYSMWVKLNNYPGCPDLMTLVGRETSGSGTQGAIVVYCEGGRGYEPIDNNFGYYTGGYFSQSLVKPSLEQWHHIVYAEGGSGVFTWYVDGVQTNTDIDPTISDLVDSFKIGASTDRAYFNGSIDEVAIWNRVLSASDVSTLYNGGAGMSIITP